MAVGSLDPARLHAVAINRQPSHPPLCVWCVPCTVIVCTVIEIVDTLSPYYDIGHARPTLCVATVSIGLLTLKCERNTSLRHHDGLMGTIEASAIELSDVFGLH